MEENVGWTRLSIWCGGFLNGRIHKRLNQSGDSTHVSFRQVRHEPGDVTTASLIVRIEGEIQLQGTRRRTAEMDRRSRSAGNPRGATPHIATVDGQFIRIELTRKCGWSVAGIQHCQQGGGSGQRR